MPSGFRALRLFGKADMAKATAKVPTTGKEDLSGWEKKVDIAAPSIIFIKIRFAPRRVDSSGCRTLVPTWGLGIGRL